MAYVVITMMILWPTLSSPYMVMTMNAIVSSANRRTVKHLYLVDTFILALLHAREQLYSNSTIIAGWPQSTRAQITLCMGTFIHSMSKFFTTNNFHNDFCSCGITTSQIFFINMIRFCYNLYTGGKPRNYHEIVLTKFCSQATSGHIVVVSRPRIG